MKPSEPNIAGSIECPAVPPESGVYFVTDDAGQVLYVGKSLHLQRRVAHLLALQLDKRSGYSHLKAGLVHEAQQGGGAVHVHYVLTDELGRVETEMIAKYAPPWNWKPLTQPA